MILVHVCGSRKVNGVIGWDSVIQGAYTSTRRRTLRVTL